jgi:AcrR family transcriptional regulator
VTGGHDRVGRPRDEALDARILQATQDLLREGGLQAVSVARVAERAGTTRPSVYRRHRDRVDLAVAALSAVSAATAPPRTDDPLADLVAELTAFREGIVGLRGLELVAGMLSEAVEEEVRQTYRRVVVAPRRQRIIAILADARHEGLLAGDDDDLAVAAAACTGSWYALALAGTPPPPDWPHRTARLVWRGLGGR